jgi:hypothetical protein
VSALGDRVLDGLGETFRKQAGPLLAPIVEALVAPAVAIDELLEPTAGGWARAFDLDTTTVPAMIGAATGTPIPSGLTLEEQRAYLREQPGRRRGSAASIIAAARAAAPGRQVDLFERLGSPWHLQVRLTGGANDAGTIAAVEEAVQRQKPVGITLEVVVVAGATYQHMINHHGPTYAAQAAAFGTYEDERTHVPEGGTTP